MFCELCGQHARHPKSPEADLRRKECPRFPGAPGRVQRDGFAPPQRLGVIHRGCCAQEVCSERDARGHVRCGWDHGGRERVAALVHPRDRRDARIVS